MVVVDDDSTFAAALTALLEAEEIEVVGTAANGRDAIDLVRELEPDLVTMDLDMPVMDGVEATIAIGVLGVPVVIVSGSQSSERVGEAVAAGAMGCVVKREASHVLAPVVRAIVLARAAGSLF